jgi:hypothetical protein
MDLLYAPPLARSCSLARAPGCPPPAVPAATALGGRRAPAARGAGSASVRLKCAGMSHVNVPPQGLPTMRNVHSEVAPGSDRKGANAKITFTLPFAK